MFLQYEEEGFPQLPQSYCSEAFQTLKAEFRFVKWLIDMHTIIQIRQVLNLNVVVCNVI